jgi:hypothetical protein
VQSLNLKGETNFASSIPEMEERSTPLKWSIDQKQEARSPYYLTKTFPITHTTADSDAYGKKGSGGADPSPATMNDMPGSPIAGSRHFESCAVCRSGKDIGAVYACATWGYTRDLIGKITLMPRSVSDSPSWIFLSAATSWNKWNKEKPVTPPRMELPDFGGGR